MFYRVIMEENWQKIDGTPINNLAEYVRAYLITKNEPMEIFIGTDAQAVGKQRVKYAKVLCFYTIGRGAHIIYSKVRKDDVKDMYTKLWWEVEYSLEIANYLKDNNILPNTKLVTIHIDVSPKLENASNSIYNGAVGYVKSMGFDCETKPNACAASYAADAIVKEKI